VRNNLVKIASLVFFLLTVAGGVAVWGLMQFYQVSLTGLINKVAVRLNVVKQDQQLVLYAQRYQDLNVNQKQKNPYPRIFLTALRGWDGLATPTFYQARLDQIKANRLGFRSHCKNKNIKNQLHCFLALPTRSSMRDIERLLIDYKLTMPTLNGSYGNSWQFAMFYDIAKATPYFSAAASQTINNKIAATLKVYLELLDSDIASLWHGRTSLAASAFLLATVLEVDTAQQQMLYRRAYGHFYDVYQAISATETWPEGYNYWINTRALVTVMALSALAEQQQSHINADKIKATINRIGLWHIYLTRPDIKIEGWGDEGPRTDLKDETARVIDLIGQITKKVVFFEYAQVIRKKFNYESYYSSYRWQLPFFYAHSAINTLKTSDSSMSQLAGELPTSELFGADFTNHMSIRSDWGNDATFVTYKAGHTFSHHQHYDAGHFTVFKGAPLAVNASRYQGNVNTDNRKYFSIRTLAKNSLLIQKNSEAVKPHRLFTANVAGGGQRVVMPQGSAITSFEHWQQQLYKGQHVEGAKLISFNRQEALYTSITSDLTSAYNSNRYDANGDIGKVRRVERTLAYLERQDMVLVYDNIQTIDNQDKTKWLLHSINKPEFSRERLLEGNQYGGIFTTQGQVAKISTEQSNMRVDILAPQLSQTLVVGGEKYRFYVETDGDDSILNGRNISGGSKEKKWFDLPQWRLEISPQQQTLSTHYLVAMQPRIAQDNMPVLKPSPVISTGVNATRFGQLLVLSQPRFDKWQLTLDSSVNELVIFVDKAMSLKIGQEPQRYSLGHGFNYIDLPSELSNKVTLRTVQSF